MSGVVRVSVAVAHMLCPSPLPCLAPLLLSLFITTLYMHHHPPCCFRSHLDRSAVASVSRRLLPLFVVFHVFADLCPCAAHPRPTDTLWWSVEAKSVFLALICLFTWILMGRTTIGLSFYSRHAVGSPFLSTPLRSPRPAVTCVSVTFVAFAVGTSPSPQSHANSTTMCASFWLPICFLSAGVAR